MGYSPVVAMGLIVEAGAVRELIRRQFYERHRLVSFKICSAGLPVRLNGLKEIRYQVLAHLALHIGLDRRLG